MVTTRELKGSKEQILKQIDLLEGRILSALLRVDEPAAREENTAELSDDEVAKIRREMEADMVSAPLPDYSREAMYARMPGE